MRRTLIAVSCVLLFTSPLPAQSQGPDDQAQTGAAATRVIRVGKVFTRRGMDLSPDGRRLAVSDYSPDAIKIIDVNTGSLVRTLTCEGCSDFETLRFSADGHLLASTEFRNIVIWNLETGSVLYTFPKDTKIALGSKLPVDINCLSFSPDDRLLAAGDDSPNNTVKIFDVSSGAMIRTWKATEAQFGGVEALSLSPDGKFMVTGSQSMTVKVWDPSTGTLIRTFPGRLSYGLHAGVFSPDGRLLGVQAKGNSAGVELVDVSNGSVASTLAKGTTAVPVGFSSDGRRLIIETDNFIVSKMKQECNLGEWDIGTDVPTRVLASWEADDCVPHAGIRSPSNVVVWAGQDGQTVDLAQLSEVRTRLDPRQSLNQYIAGLKVDPGDMALREKAIKLALTLKPEPAAPSEADELFGKAMSAFKSAASNPNASQHDYSAAGESFEKAGLLAPWVPKYWFNAGLAFEKANFLDQAIADFRSYLLAAPDAKDANDVYQRIGGLQNAKQKTEEVGKLQDLKLRFVDNNSDGSAYYFIDTENIYPLNDLHYLWMAICSKSSPCPALEVGTEYNVHSSSTGATVETEGGTQRLGFSLELLLCVTTSGSGACAFSGSNQGGANVANQSPQVSEAQIEQNVAAHEQQVISNLSGSWNCQSGCSSASVSVTGNSFTVDLHAGDEAYGVAGTLAGLGVSGTVSLPSVHDARTHCNSPATTVSFSGTISEDGKSIVLNFSVPHWQTHGQPSIIGTYCTGVDQVGTEPVTVALTR
jgi:WD40 repeat protein